MKASHRARLIHGYIECGYMRDGRETVRWRDLHESLERNGFDASTAWELVNELGLRAEYPLVDVLSFLGF